MVLLWFIYGFFMVFTWFLPPTQSEISNIPYKCVPLFLFEHRLHGLSDGYGNFQLS